jgi:hypothetical protein
MELFASIFNGHALAASIEATLAIHNMHDYNSPIDNFVNF